MQSAIAKLVKFDKSEKRNYNLPGCTCIGQLVRVDGLGRPFVIVSESEPIAVAARCIAQIWNAGAQGLIVPSPVLLFLESGDPSLPVIVGFVQDRLTFAPNKPQLKAEARTQETLLDGKRLQFEATEEVVLKCGRGSITLKANGSIVIKGTEVISRASGVNKIKGATVNIN